MLFAITMLGSAWVMVPIGMGMAWRLTVMHRRRQAVLLAIGYLVAELLSNLLKAAFQRPRPAVYFQLLRADTFSFPSGHALVSTVFYGLTACVLASVYPSRRAGAAIAVVVIALTIGLSRVYLGYHYPSDVLAGWTCAIGWLALCGPAVYEAGEPQK
ncbi:MAG: phosphatase PAP2 family protein [Ignavibacteriota bacterium]